MQFSVGVIASFLAFSTAFATPVTRDNSNDGHDPGLQRICPGLNTQEKGCVRCEFSIRLLHSIDPTDRNTQTPEALT